MKKIVTLVLALTMLLGAFALVACDNGTETETQAEVTLKLGVGTSVAVSATDATDDVKGKGQATVTVAAVLVDENGKIVKAFIDCADNTVEYTVEGKAIANDSFLTKYEAGSEYGMVAYGGATKEWFEQADAFCGLIAGKTVAEVKALVAENAKGTEEVLNAGCTIYVSDFAKAVEKAVANAVNCNAIASNTLKLGVTTTQTVTDATEDKAGSNKLETTFFAAAVDAEGKVVAAYSDSVEFSFGFDVEGASTFDATKAVATKRDQGDSYGMVAYGGAAKEWNQQAAAFDAACVGKTAQEIQGLMGEDYKGVADLQAAGCTIYVSNFVKAATKIG